MVRMRGRGRGEIKRVLEFSLLRLHHVQPVRPRSKDNRTFERFSTSHAPTRRGSNAVVLAELGSDARDDGRSRNDDDD